MKVRKVKNMKNEQIKKIGKEAIIPNPKLKTFEILIGKWITNGFHPLMPGITLHGKALFEWIEGGAFLMMRTEIDEPGIPSGMAIIGTDDKLDESYMLYFDERGVSRKYNVKLEGNIWHWWRNEHKFSQRFTGTIQEQGRKIIGKGEICKDDKTWELDLNFNYTKLINNN